MAMLADFRKGDRGPALLAFLSLLGTTAAHTLLETARDALFLARMPASRLAWMILAIAACGLALTRLDRGERQARFAPAPLAIVAAVTCGFWLVLGVTAHPVVVHALYLWTGVAASWILLRFWLALGARFTISEGKRLFGFIGLGSVLGAVAGAACARALAFVVGARGLVLAASVLFLATALGPVAALARASDGVRAAHAPRMREARAGGRDWREVRADPYAVRILALVLLGTVALTLVDYLFKAAAQAHFGATSRRDALVAFFATASFVMSALALVVQIVGSGWLLRAIGVQRALLVLPVLVVAGAAGFAVTGTLMAALLMKGADGSLRHSLHRTGVELLFLPISDGMRQRAKPIVDLVGQRGGQALASVMILLFGALGAPPAVLGVCVIALGAAWIAVTLDVQRHYLDLFRATLREGHADAESVLAGGVAPPLAAPVLLDLALDAPEEIIRYRSIVRLCQLRITDPELPIAEVGLSLAAEHALRDAFGSLEARTVLARTAGGEAHDALRALLRDRETAAIERLFRIFGLLHPGENFDHVHRGLASDDPRTRASSRELCEHIVAAPLREAVLVLIDELGDEERLARAASHFPPSRLDVAGQLRGLLGHAPELADVVARYTTDAGLGLETPPVVLPEPPWTGVDFRGRDLTKASLAGASLTGADLRGCRLRGATLTDASLVGARLEGADLTGADLEGANLTGAGLDRALLVGARLARTNLLGAKAKRAIFSCCKGEGAHFMGALFEGADFAYAELRSCDMRAADFRASRLDGADFGGSDFSTAILTGASRRRTKMDVR